MNGTNGNEPGYPENALVPYPVIVAATMIDPKNNTSREQNLYVWVSTGAKDNAGQKSSSEAPKAC